MPSISLLPRQLTMSYPHMCSYILHSAQPSRSLSLLKLFRSGESVEGKMPSLGHLADPSAVRPDTLIKMYIAVLFCV